MKALGIAARVSKWKSSVTLVLLEEDIDDESAATVVELLTVTEDVSDWAAHVGNVAKAVRGHAKSMEPETVVLRRADQGPQSRNSDGPKLRLMIEGGIVAACLDVTSDVQVRSGKECGKARGTSKEELDAMAANLAGKNHSEAAAAALSAMP